MLQLILPSTAEMIRPARADDFAQVRSLLEQCSLPLDGVPATLAGYAVAVGNGRILGIAGMEEYGRYGLLRSVAVDSSARGRGIARNLVEKLIDDERAKGAESIFLLTTTAASYFPVLGFVEVDRESVPDEIRSTEQFTDTCPSSATIMRLDLRT